MSFHLLLFLSIPHLDNSLSPLLLPAEGKSLMPLCHFELEESDYLSEKGGGYLLEGNTETTSARVLEFAPCSLGHRTSRSAKKKKKMTPHECCFLFLIESLM